MYVPVYGDGACTYLNNARKEQAAMRTCIDFLILPSTNPLTSELAHVETCTWKKRLKDFTAALVAKLRPRSHMHFMRFAPL